MSRKNEKKPTDGIQIPQIRSNIKGFQDLAKIYVSGASSLETEIRLQMPSWFDADMMAVLGGVINLLRAQGKKVTFYWKKRLSEDRVRKIALKNLFLKRMRYGEEKVAEDTNKTTIQFQVFQPQQDKEFNDYVWQHFIPGKNGLFKMSDKVLKEFRRGIIELYNNASDHSSTKQGIFVCGQRFPFKEELVFMVVDLGIGVVERIKASLGMNMSPEGALRWAFQAGNTTRKGAGGQGLKLLKEAIGLNKGSIQFVSNEGYLSIEGADENFEQLEYPFPGTAVCIKFRTNDKNKYYFKDELNSTGSGSDEN